MSDINIIELKYKIERLKDSQTPKRRVCVEGQINEIIDILEDLFKFLESIDSSLR